MEKVKAAGEFATKGLRKKALQIVIASDVEHVANSIKAQLQNLVTFNTKNKVKI